MKKYKLENFSLHIIEFCTPDVFICSDLEQKWTNCFKPKGGTQNKKNKFEISSNIF